MLSFTTELLLYLPLSHYVRRLPRLLRHSVLRSDVQRVRVGDRPQRGEARRPPRVLVEPLVAPLGERARAHGLVADRALDEPRRAGFGLPFCF